MKPLPIFQDYQIATGASTRRCRYRAVFIPSADGARHRCTLVLTGTGTQVADVAYFLNRLWQQGGAVAAIERSIGSPLAIGIRPAVERPAAMTHFLQRLDKDFGVALVNVVAHSYAAQEVVRVLESRPVSAVPPIGTLTLINPSGFGNTGKFVPHCLRFVFLFLLREYLHNLQAGPVCQHRERATAADSRRARQAIRSLAVKTFCNPVRTFREVADIISSDLRPTVRRMVEQEGLRVLVVLSCQDSVVSAETTREFFRALPPVGLLDLPGNHLDPLLYEGCVQAVLATLKAKESPS